jgi:hypothetical protein
MTNSPTRSPLTAAPVPNPRATRVAAKQVRFNAIKASHTLPRVRVLPANEDIRRVLKHPRGMAFRTTGSVEWPYDQFTIRRLAAGEITLEQRHEEAV